MGKILTDNKRINIAIILLLIIAMLYIIFGALYVIRGTFQTYHVAYTGKTAQDVDAYSSKLMYLISTFVRLIGFYFLGNAFCFLYVIFKGFKNNEKWAWDISLILGIFSVIPLLIFTFPILAFNYVYFIIIGGAAAWLIALCISYKEISK